jgi:hypothetical protein
MPTRYGKAILGMRDPVPDGVCRKDGASADSQFPGDFALVKFNRLATSLSMAISPTVAPEAVPERITDCRGLGAGHFDGSFRSSEMEDGTE